MNWEQNADGGGYAQPTNGLGILSLTYPTRQRKEGVRGGGGGGLRMEK